MLENKRKIKLVALDMDGTLFNSQSKISEEDKAVIRDITSQGTEVVISTGRPYEGIPLELLYSLGIRYAITTNGAAIYELPGKKCIYEETMDFEVCGKILSELLKKEIHMDVFIGGKSYSQISVQKYVNKLAYSESIKKYIMKTRDLKEDLVSYIRDGQLPVQKVTLNFFPIEDGSFKDREAAIEILNNFPEIDFLSGGFSNLEFMKSGVSKGKGLKILCEKAGWCIEDTLACGDSPNDIDIIRTAGIGVAMGNASEDVKEAADFITKTNEESGVAYAIQKFLNLDRPQKTNGE